MKKDQLLKEIRTAAASSDLTKRELLDAFQEGKSGSGDAALFHRVGITDLLYYLGGIIVLLGIVVLAVQHWDSFNMFLRILITLGSAIIAYVVGVLLRTNRKTESLSQIFFTLSFVLLPTGLLVTFHEFGYDVGMEGLQSFVSALLLALAAASMWLYKKALFAAFAVIFGTWLFVALTAWLTRGAFVYADSFTEYRILVIGASYLLLAQTFARKHWETLTDILNMVGAVAILGASLSLGGWFPDRSIFWELVYPAIVFGFMFAGAHLRIRSFLFFGAIFLMAYVGKITGEYFQDSLGWPLALVLAGFALMGIGYLTFYLNRKYIAK